MALGSYPRDERRTAARSQPAAAARTSGGHVLRNTAWHIIAVPRFWSGSASPSE